MKIKEESGDHADDGDSFASKKPWQRFLVLIAGVVMNLFLAAVLFSIGYMAGLPSVIDDMLPESARVAEQTLTVMQVIEGSPAQEAGVVAGDSIALIDGQLFVSDEVAREYLATNGEQGVELTLVNEVGEERVISATSDEDAS